MSYKARSNYALTQLISQADWERIFNEHKNEDQESTQRGSETQVVQGSEHKSRRKKGNVEST